GVDWSIERMLNFYISQSTVSRIEIRQDATRLRPFDVPILRGSREKIETTLGWRPAIPLETTLTDLLEYWRRRIRSRASYPRPARPRGRARASHSSTTG